MFMDKPGIREALRAFGRRLAGHGYDVILPDLYHRHGRMIGYGPADLAADPGAGDQLMSLLMSLTDEGIQNDLDAGAGGGGRRPAGRVAGAGRLHRLLPGGAGRVPHHDAPARPVQGGRDVASVVPWWTASPTRPT